MNAFPEAKEPIWEIPPQELHLPTADSDKARCFSVLWTRKEAVWKAVGSGILRGLRDVSGRNKGSSSFPSGKWQLHSFSLEKKAYAAGLALDPPAFRLRFFPGPGKS